MAGRGKPIRYPGGRTVAIFLSGQQHERLRRAASKELVSVSEIARRAVDAYFLPTDMTHRKARREAS